MATVNGMRGNKFLQLISMSSDSNGRKPLEPFVITAYGEMATYERRLPRTLSCHHPGDEPFGEKILSTSSDNGTRKKSSF